MKSEKNKLSITVVVPVYNEAEYLAECLDAVYKQTRPADEVLIVDNNSTDASMEIANKYKNIRIITEEEQGIVYARNRGFNEASGNIIARIDADSRVSENWLEMVEHLMEDTSISAITGPVYYYDAPFAEKNLVLDRLYRDNFNRFVKDFVYLFGTNMAMRKDAWMAVANDVCSNEELIHEDVDLALHLDEKGYKIMYAPDLVVGMSYRRVDDSPKEFYEYLARNVHTYELHGRKTTAAKIPVAIFMSVYPAFKVFRKLQLANQTEITLSMFTRTVAMPRNLSDKVRSYLKL